MTRVEAEPGVVAAELAPPFLPRARPDRVYCNRSLRLDQVKMVGFDMDYTLAVYRQPEIDRLSVAATVRRLVERGWPEALLGFTYPTTFAIRGLLVDTRLGNVLKMDRYRYVKRAYHGLTELSRDERRALYEPRRLRPGIERYHWVDTLYALCEVVVYATAVDGLERAGHEIDYAALFDDVRTCIDEAHGSGEVFAALAAELDRYVERDPRLPALLHRLRSSGKRLFLLTNSRPEATETIMAHLLESPAGRYRSWRQYFDVVVTAARKPLFFTGAASFAELGGSAPAAELRRGRVYQGGSIVEFERLLEVSGAEVLYVGDHIYGDVLRANVESGWRTVMIIQEMAEELAAIEAQRDSLERIDQLDDELSLCQDSLLDLRAEAAGDAAEPGAAEAAAARLRRQRAAERLAARIRSLGDERDALEHEVELAFHPYWGSLFWAGTELSSFASQVQRYAWLYTDRAANLGGYSPMHRFRSPRASLPHEL